MFISYGRILRSKKVTMGYWFTYIIIFFSHLIGHRGEFNFKDHMGMLIEDKVIVVADGGTLEVHGKRSYTGPS